MRTNQEEYISQNKTYIEHRVREIGGELGLDGSTTKWRDEPDGFKLQVYSPQQSNHTILIFRKIHLCWKTYCPQPGDDIEEFLESERKLQPESYKRKKEWDEQIRTALREKSHKKKKVIGFSPLRQSRQ